MVDFLELAKKQREKTVDVDVFKDDKKEKKKEILEMQFDEEAPVKPKNEKKKNQKKEKSEIILDSNTMNETMDLAIIAEENRKPGALMLPSKEEIDYRIKLIEYIKNSVVSKEDYGTMHNQTFLKASGYDKFIHYFKLNLSYPKRDVYEDKEGWHCDTVCRVEAPWGQTIEAYGGASMDMMLIKKTRHNMKALADTRAKTRAVRTLMGFSKPSYEEMIGSGEDKEDWF